MDILVVLYRTLLVLVILFILAKLIGKKQISQMNLFDYIIGITIGSIAADISLDIEKDLIAGISCLLIYLIASLLLSFINMKSISLRRVLVGVPTILVEKGNIIESGLKKVKITVNDLLEEARISGYFNLDEIDYALMETNGKISFLIKDSDKPVTKKDINLESKPQLLAANLIIDEVILDENLEDINKDKKWLLQQLKVQGFKSAKGILLATIDTNGKLRIYKKNVDVQKRSVLE